jgi:hypothetical protein
MKKRYLAALAALLSPASAFALETWEPLITAQHFTGIRADILLAVGGILGILLIILGLKALARVF